MSYKALLFCPDEEAARLVTQVLSELEFTVELSFEPFATVKKLTDEPFDALVVDCANDENASVLFKGARSSTLNHSSLCVAVAEGQAGVAKAFKIGANLVLTKPINIEQSKNTLRVARGLLRKNAGGAKPATGPSEQSHTATTGSTFGASAPAIPSTPALSAIPAPAGSAAPAPTQTPSAGSHSHGIGSPAPANTSGFASSGAAAAAAPAPERSAASLPATRPVPEIKSAPPLATHDPIIPETHFTQEPERHAPTPAPTFSSYASHQPATSRSGSKFVWIALVILVAGAAGYFGWRKFQPLQYLHRSAPVTASQSSAPAPAVTVEEKPSPDVAAPAQQTASAAAGTTSALPNSTTATAPETITAAPEGFPTKESIVVGSPTEGPEHAVTVAPKPIQVSKQSPRTAAPRVEQPAPAPAPPSLALNSDSQGSALAGIVSAPTAVVPKPAQALRISQGITQGLLMKRVPPTYPPTAIQLRKEGSVELLASITKTGAISQVKVLSGDPALARAAVDAVRQWKYRPYLLNNEPVEIETQITVNFKLPH